MNRRGVLGKKIVERAMETRLMRKLIRVEFAKNGEEKLFERMFVRLKVVYNRMF